LALSLVASCRRQEPVEEQQAQSQERAKTTEAEQTRIRQELQTLTTRHSADYEWKAAADDSLFTAQVEDILLSKAPRPLLISAFVTDIQRQEGRYLLVAQSTISISDLFLRLKCSPSQAEYVMNVAENGGYLGWFAIVFRPESVYRPTWELAAQPDGDTAYIAVQEASAWFTKGECLDLLYVGQKEIDLKDVLDTNPPDSSGREMQ
jgi:hypothetical protein